MTEIQISIPNWFLVAVLVLAILHIISKFLDIAFEILKRKELTLMNKVLDKLNKKNEQTNNSKD